MSTIKGTEMRRPYQSGLTFTSFQRKSYFTPLDSLRAISILLVLFHHAPGLGKESLFWTLQENGRYGVGFFFVISGFLICTLFLREEARCGRMDLWKFYGRRALRLLPLYYAVLALQAVLVFGLHQYTPENQQLFREKLPAYLFYYSNLIPTMTQGPFFCAWSLAVEEQFYLLFGLILVFCRRRAVIWGVAAVLLIKVVVYQLFGAVDAHSRIWLVIFSYREPILLGVLAAFALNTKSGYGILEKFLGKAWVVGIAGIATAAWVVIHPMRHESAWDSQLLYLLMTILVIGVVMAPSIPLLSGGVLVHIGKVSYGIYLLHMFVRSSLKRLPWGENVWLSFAATAVVTIILASVVYKYFEHPIIEFYKRKLSPRDSRRVDTTVEPEVIAVQPAG